MAQNVMEGPIHRIDETQATPARWIDETQHGVRLTRPGGGDA